MGRVFSEVVLGGVVCQGWWLVVDDDLDGSTRIVAGPFPDRAEAGWVAGTSECEVPDAAHPVYGVRRADGTLNRRPSPQEWSWLAHLGEQLDRLPEDWDAEYAEDDPLATLVVEVAAALAEAGLPMHDSEGPGRHLGGACLAPEPALGGIVLTWRQHDRMCVDRIHGADADAGVQHVMNRALADVLRQRGFLVEAFGEGSGHLVGLPG